MDRLKRAALLTRLIEELQEHGSWCGETHIQKSTFFLQHLTCVPFDFEFILYKHGPYSFDLRDELTSLRADELLELEPRYPYGPGIVPTERSEYIQGACSKTVRKYEGQIAYVSKKLGGKEVADLERLATAYLVTLSGKSSAKRRARKLTELKPHISPEAAKRAVHEVDRMIEEVQEGAYS